MFNYTDLLFIQSGATIYPGSVMQLFIVICTIKVALDSILLHHGTSIKKKITFLSVIVIGSIEPPPPPPNKATQRDERL